MFYQSTSFRLPLSNPLDKLANQVSLNGNQIQQINKSIENIQSNLRSKIDYINSFVIGSYARNTTITPLTSVDVDIVFVLAKEEYSPSKHTYLLDKFRNKIKESYPKTKVSRNGQAVTISFTEYTIDAVPAFQIPTGKLVIPDSTNGTWITSDPIGHSNHILREDQNRHHYNLLPTIKVLKEWNRESDKFLKSIYLELLATQIFSNATITKLSPQVIRHFFENGCLLVQYAVQDPTSYRRDYIHGLRYGTVEQAVKKFQDAYQLARLAEIYFDQGNFVSAYSKLKELFGSRFPI